LNTPAVGLLPLGEALLSKNLCCGIGI